jgi:hypothetical protein
MEISIVPFGKVAGLVPALLPYLEESEKWTKGRSTADDILKSILNGQMQLWAVHDQESIYGHVITEVKQYPQCKMLVVQYCAMKPWTMDLVSAKMHETAERFAKDAECAGIEFVGRPGWRDVAKQQGYTVQSVVYQKFFKEV